MDYLLLSSLWYDRYFSQPRSDLYAKRRIRDVFERVPVVQEFRPRHGTYGFHNPTVTLFSLSPEAFAALDAQRAEKAAGAIDATSNELRASFRWDH